MVEDNSLILQRTQSLVAPAKQSGLEPYYLKKISEMEIRLVEKQNNLRRLEAQRNEMNTKVKDLKEELHKLLEGASSVGEVIKMMGKRKCLVKANDSKYIVEVDRTLNAKDLVANTRVALKDHEGMKLHMIMPNKKDPLVSLMKVEKIPDSTYDQIGGLEQQIKEVKEVIELPIKHPEIFESLGIAQPKGVLLYGPPGTGKTLLARAVAHHTKCQFIRVSGSELV